MAFHNWLLKVLKILAFWKVNITLLFPPLATVIWAKNNATVVTKHSSFALQKSPLLFNCSL